MSNIQTQSANQTPQMQQQLPQQLNDACTSFLLKVLNPPSYGFTHKDGTFYKPSHSEIWKQFASRLNVFASKKNWLVFVSSSAVFGLSAFTIAFLTLHFSWPLFFVGLVYAMVALGSHGTMYLHRYSTHRAYTFKNNFWRFVCRNLSIKVIPEEIYVISHHVHHSISEKPGDPYNTAGGWLYCFLADANHQTIATDLSESDYGRLCALMKHTGVQVNTYQQYLKYGSLANPLRTVAHYLLNWGFWFATFYLIGGVNLAFAIFGMSAVWAFGVRTFNYEGHGKGKDRRRVGVDFHTKDLSVNQMWPGFVAGEWHNNHHLYPNGARSGFLPHQLDIPWLFIKSWHTIGAISSYRDFKEDFLEKHYRPFQNRKKNPSPGAPLVVSALIAPDEVVVEDVASMIL